MNIAYDIFIKHPELEEVASNIPELDEAFLELLRFVQGRLMPLADQIDIEEESSSDGAGTIIFMQPPPETPNRFLVFAGYSPELGAKMASCFNPSDITYIENKLMAILDRWQQ